MTQFPAGLPTGMPSLPTPDARYILPQFEERTAYGFKRQDPYNKLFEDRTIFLGVQVDDAEQAFVIVLQAHPVANRLARGLKLLAELLGSASRPYQFHHLTAELTRIRGMGLRHVDILLSPKYRGVHQTGVTPYQP